MVAPGTSGSGTSGGHFGRSDTLEPEAALLLLPIVVMDALLLLLLLLLLDILLLLGEVPPGARSPEVG